MQLKRRFRLHTTRLAFCKLTLAHQAAETRCQRRRERSTNGREFLEHLKRGVQSALQPSSSPSYATRFARPFMNEQVADTRKLNNLAARQHLVRAIGRRRRLALNRGRCGQISANKQTKKHSMQKFDPKKIV